MAENNTYIEHEGLVLEADGSHVLVKVIVKSACSGCHIKGSCNLAETQDKHIEVNHNRHGFSEGDRVMISMKTVMGYKALFLGYLLPFSVILISLIIGLSIFQNEGAAAGFSLVFAVVYYGLLYFFRKNIQKGFRYTLNPLP